MKASYDQIVMENEICSLIQIQRRNGGESSLIPKVIEYGQFNSTAFTDEEHGEEMFYYLMPYYGQQNLDQYLGKLGDVSAHAKCGIVLRIAQKVTEALELVHSAGYTYNDLKGENIMIDDSDGELKIHLIDFGFASPFLVYNGSNFIHER